MGRATSDALDDRHRNAMSNLVYLLVALVGSGVGLLALWIRSRPAPSSPRTSIEQFNEKMNALSPHGEPRGSNRSRRGA